MIRNSLVVAGLLTVALAAPEPGTFHLKFEKRYGQSDTDTIQRRQSGTIYSLLTNEEIFYLVNVTVGTPPQKIGLQIDTGSSDVWFPDGDSNICSQVTGGCPLGEYNYKKSSTFGALANYPEFDIGYVDGTQISGAYFSDVLNIGGVDIQNLTMAAASSGARGFGILGVAFSDGESIAQSSGVKYPSIMETMKAEGLINDLSYSLWLDDRESNTGSILFGGIDTSKYHGQLVSLPIQPDSRSDDYTSFTVIWSGLTVSDTNPSWTADYSPSTPQGVILDSGTTVTILPDDIVNAILQGFGVTTDPQLGNLVPCKLQSNNVTFAFQFGGSGGPVINVPLSEFIRGTIESRKGTPLTFDNGDVICRFGLQAAAGRPLLFGDTFLRSAYVVYDLDNLQIAIAQTNFGGSTAVNSADVQVIQATGIPDVQSTASGFSVTQTFTDGLYSGAATGTGFATVDPSSTPTDDVVRTATLSLTATGTVAATATGSTTGASSGASSGSQNGAGPSTSPTFLGSALIGAALAGIVALGSGMLVL